MKRREFLKAAGVGLAASTAVAAPAIAQSMPTIKWRMPCSWPKSLDTIYGGAEMMCKAVKEATDGKFEIQIFAAGEIVPGLQIVDAVQAGTVEIGHTASYYYFGKDPTFGFGTSVPFGPNARINQAWWTQGGGEDVLNEFFKTYNARALLAGNTGCQMGGWFRKEINYGRRSQGSQDADRRMGRKDSAKARRRAAADRRAATSIRRSRRARSMPANGSVPTTTRSSASTRSRRTTTRRAGGKAARCCSPSSTWRNGTRCRSTIRRCSSRPAISPTPG